MISIGLEHVYLLELLKAALFNCEPVIPNDADWNKILSAAKTQCLVPLLRPYVPETYYNEWNKISYQYQAHYMQMIYTQNSLIQLLNQNRVPYVILKGTSSAIYYPNPLLRAFGDIDIYVSNDYIETILQILKANSYVYISNNDRHFEFEKNGIDIEIHSRFSCEYYKDIDQIVLIGLNNATTYKVNNYSFSGLPTYENGLVLLGHIMQHLKGSGIGLRQIIDWMMFVHNCLDDSAWETFFRQLAIEAGLENLAITVTFMCRKWLGLPNIITWCDKADEDIADQLLVFILDDGNLGQDRAPYESIKNSMNKEGGVRYLQRLGVASWPLAQKYVVFRPFAWLYQMIKYLYQGICGLMSGKKIFIKYKHKMSLEEIWKRLE